ncbi:dipeptide/oligopeptide/nickel ABC transporter ATP-binding protein [Frondihabitans sucicola]|uniref:Dipeptide/oligopeptide/nickel ABC transporter ATP-binding protein n=1 Tax=Frondihabitans sucicola TaxID=1268041 RepID=A0ABM8GU85_9MICO|nr:dipeptide/oligopeptide/nickel ABC transporter permease/ATP-binding protein [Frondihabitans sucicola]BDZ52041.1 dipeptide/oligopeptide/nickel ABC transporter ATP-binding protein [Frondihabitans sucicola]
MIILTLAAVVAVIEPWILPFPPERVQIQLTNAAPFTTEYLLGGDKFGRDILSELIAGTRDAILASLILTSIAVGLGTAFGLVAGYFGGIIDTVCTWVFGVLIAVPGIILLIALYTLIDISMPVAMAALGVLSSTGIFYLVRSLTRNVRNEPYVDAARVSGLSNLRIVGRHVLLAIRGPIVILAAFLAGGALAVSAGLDFLGLGDSSKASWGSILNDAFGNYYIAPWQLIWPGLTLGLVMASFVILGNAMRDAMEGTYIKPSARARRREVAEALRHAGIREQDREAGGSAPTERSDALLDVSDLRVGYRNGDSLRSVIRGVSFQVRTGEVLGLVGESGSGKTQTVFSALGLLPESAIVIGGSIRLDGHELLGRSERELSRFRGAQMAYVPQEPMSNLDPSFRVGPQIVEGIRVQTDLGRREATSLALDMLEKVGIRDPRRTFRSYPHEISGGMAQRVLIAAAIACKPKLLIADEPTTALDVTVQAEVLDLLRDLQQEFRMGVLIVTHNLGVVADLCDRVIVMREGEIVETGDVGDVLKRPSHEYTKTLLDSLLDEAEPKTESPSREESARV